MRTSLLLLTLITACKSSTNAPPKDHVTPPLPVSASSADIAGSGSGSGSAATGAPGAQGAVTAIAFALPEPITAGPPVGTLVTTVYREVKHVEQATSFVVDVATKKATALGKDASMVYGPWEQGKTLFFPVDNKGKPTTSMLVRTGAKPVPVDAKVVGLSPDGKRALLAECDKDYTPCLAPMADGKIGEPRVMISKDLGAAELWLAGTIYFVDVDKLTLVNDVDGKPGKTVQVKTGNGLDISLDGTLIAWAVKGEGENEDKAIAVAKLDAPEKTKTFPFPSTYAANCLFAGTTRLVCQMPSDDQQAIVTIELATGKVIELTKRSFTTTPVLSPDGRYIAFSEVDKNNVPRAAITPIDHSAIELLSLPGKDKELIEAWLR